MPRGSVQPAGRWPQRRRLDNSRWTPRKLAPWGVLAFSIVLALGLFAVRQRIDPWLANHLAAQLAGANEQQTAALLDQLAEIGPAGWPAVVEALDSPRAGVRQAAATALSTRIAAWQLSGSPAIAERQRSLAVALRTRLPRMGATGQRLARGLIYQWLAALEGGVTADSHALQAECRELLVLLPQEPQDYASDGAEPLRPTSNASHSSTLRRRETPSAPVASRPLHALYETATTSPAENHPAAFTEPRSTTNGPPTERKPSRPLKWSSPNRPAEPELHPAQGGMQGEISVIPGRLPVEAAQARPLVRSRPEDTALVESSDESPSESRSAGPDADGADTETPDDASVEELLTRLRTAAGATTPELLTRLKSAGLDPFRLQLAERLTDPDPQTRRRWAAALPSLAGLDAEPWLQWLSTDDDAEVRLTALGLMATSNNQGLQQRVAQMGRDDPDRRVRQAAERAAAARRNRR